MEDDTKEQEELSAEKAKMEHQDLEYLTHIANEDFGTLRDCLEHQALSSRSKLQSASQLSDSCIYSKQNWFLHLDTNRTEDRHFKEAYVVFNFLKLLKPTEELDYFMNRIDAISGDVERYVQEDPFWDFCWNKILQLDKIMKICKKFSINLSKKEVHFVFTESDTVKMLTLVLEVWKNISLELLSELEKYHFYDYLETFSALALIMKMFHSIVDDDDVNCKIDSFEEQFMLEFQAYYGLIHNDNLKTEVVEDIFAMLFLRKSHLYQKVENDSFICDANKIRVILNVLPKLNEHITNALWKFQLLEDLKETNSTQIMEHMLSSPEALVAMCLKHNHFEKAHEVIERFRLFDLSAPLICFDVVYEIRQHLTKLQDDDKIPFIALQKDNIDQITEQIVARKVYQHDYIRRDIPPDIFYNKEEIYKSRLNTLDILLLYATSKEDCAYMLEMVVNKCDGMLTDTMYDYFVKLHNAYSEVGYKYHATLGKFIISDSSFNLEICKSEDKMYDALSAACSEFLSTLHDTDPLPLTTSNYLLFRLLLRVNAAAGAKMLHPQNKSPEYVLRLYSYLKSFSKICVIAENVTNSAHKRAVSFSQLIVTNRVELLGRLLLQVSFSSSKFEQLFQVLSLDYLYHVVGNIFPTINLHISDKILEEELYPENILYVPDENTIQDIKKRNWFLAFLLDEMYKVMNIRSMISSSRIQIFLNYMNLPKIQYYREYFFENDISAILCEDIDLDELREIFGGDADYREALSNSRFCAKESIEESTHSSVILKLLRHLPERQLSTSGQLRGLRDAILSKVVAAEPARCCGLIRRVAGRGLRTAMILDNYEGLPVKLALDVLRSEVGRYDVAVDDDYARMMVCLQKSQCYEMIASMVLVKSCQDTYDYCQFDPDTVLDNLIEMNELPLLIKFLRFHRPSRFDAISAEFVQRALNACDAAVTHPLVRQLLAALPEEHAVAVCRALLKRHRNIVDLHFICDYLLEISDDPRLRTVRLGLHMLEALPRGQEQARMLCLAGRPLHIVESLLMNTRLDRLGRVLRALRRHCADDAEREAYVAEVDDLLRSYAERSLLFPRVDSVYEALSHTLIISLSSEASSGAGAEADAGFRSPVRVPAKEQWVHDQAVRKCMCCNQTAFSMFNRRHHCRRCGRMICYKCSTKMKVAPQYGDVLVRVCKDCRAQSRRGPGPSTEDMESQSLRSFSQETWELTEDDEQNRIIRDEFSFENVPSVSLCLSIMSHHTQNDQHTKFLLDQCYSMLSMLRTHEEVAQEIDVFLVLRMIKALATTVTLCSKDNVHREADKILQKIETLELLAAKGCMKLLPITNLMTENYLDATSLNNLRDVLLENEQWYLALEISTKLRLDKTVVYNAWGRSCLKAGKLSEAREKFRLGLGRWAAAAAASASACDASRRRAAVAAGARAGGLRAAPAAAPAPHPPPQHFDMVQPLERKSPRVAAALAEILRELEGKLADRRERLQAPAPHPAEAALSILGRLRSLPAIASGRYFADLEADRPGAGPASGADTAPVYYSECVHYIKTYGSHSDLLRFFVRHGELANALHYLKDNPLGSEYHIEVYMACLRAGTVQHLLAAMSQIDSSFRTWKSHVKRICRYLQEGGYLYSLYQLQKYMGDCVRAAMTCVRFYQEDMSDYTDLVSRVHLLHEGLKHLQDALDQDQWVEVSPVQDDGVAPHQGTERKFEEKSPFDSTLILKCEPEEINRYIATVQMQIEIAEYLRDCESQSQEMENILKLIAPKEGKISKIPTLFGTPDERTWLCVLIILCGSDLQDGFKLVVNIVETFKFKPAAILYKTGTVLGEQKNFDKVVELVKLIKSEGGPFTIEMCDSMLLHIVKTVMNSSSAESASTTSEGTIANVEGLVRYIADKQIKVSAYLESGQLKSAYYIAVKYKLLSELRRVLHAADASNQATLKSVCQMVLDGAAQSW